MTAVERLDVNHCTDRFAAVLHRNIYDFVLARLAPGQRILEIGTGLGVFTQELLPRAESYLGVEFDAAVCLDAWKKLGGQAEIIQADAKCLPLKDQEFSFIVCLEVLEHLGDFRAGVKSIHRCICPGGIAVVSVPYRKTGGRSKINPYHIYEPGERELISEFQKNFTKVEVYYQFFEETRSMTLARSLHLRRLVGLDRIYADLSTGLPQALSRVQIRSQPKGLKLSLILVASGRKELAERQTFPSQTV